MEAKITKEDIILKVGQIASQFKYPINDSTDFTMKVGKELVVDKRKIDVSKYIAVVPKELFPLTSKDDVVKKFNFCYERYFPLPGKKKRPINLGVTFPQEIRNAHNDELHNKLTPDETGLHITISGLWVFVRHEDDKTPVPNSFFPGRQFGHSLSYEGWYWVMLPVEDNLWVECRCCDGIYLTGDKENIGNAMLDEAYYSNNIPIIFEIPLLGPLDWV